MTTTKKKSNSNLYDVDLVDQLARENDREILLDLGFEPIYDNSVTCCCPIHGGDNPGAFTYDPRLKRWRCWTHHCHEKYGTGLIGLIRSVKKCGFREALEYVLKIANCDIGNIDPNVIDYKKYINEQKQKKRVANIEERVFDKSLLDNLDHKVSYFLDRDFSQETLNSFQAFYASQKGKHLYGRACVPIFNFKDELVGFGGRQTDDIKTDTSILYHDRKWLYTQINLGNYLYGYSQAKELMQKYHTAIIVEGVTDVWRLHEAGLQFSVSTFSNKITNLQRKKLVELGVRHLICLFDPDDGGEVGFNNIQSNCKLYFNIYNLSHLLTTDPGDMSIEKINEIIKPEINKITGEDL